MKLARHFAASLLALALAGMLAVGLHTRWRTEQTRRMWRAAAPARPDLAKWPEPFRARLAAAEARLAAPPGDLAALGELARLYHANGFLPQAEQTYRALIRFEPGEPRWPHLLAALLASYGRLDEALPLLRKTVELAPKYGPARLHLADALVKLGQPVEAAAAYQALLGIEPHSAYARLGVARLDLGANDLVAARAGLRAAIAANANFSAAHSLLATVQERLGHPEGAAAERATATADGRFREAPDPWTDALSGYCYDVYRLQVLAASCPAGSILSEAVPLLERALALAPDDCGTLRQLGKILLGLGELSRARKLLERAVLLDPHNPAAYLDLVSVYHVTNDFPAALRTLESGLTLCPDDAGLHYEYASALLALRRPDEAIPHLEAARRLSPEKPLAARDLISTYFRLNRERKAAAILNESLARFPDFPPFLVMAARYRIMQGDATGAGSLIQRGRAAGAPAGDLAGLAADFQRRFGRPAP